MTCIPTGQRRALLGRHTNACTDPGACPGCEPCPEPHCLVCRREHADPTCPTCLGMARQNLRNVITLTAKLGAEATEGKRAHSVGTGVPGGDALVLLSPGASEDGARGQLAHRLATGLDVSHLHDELRGDPRPPVAVLLRWESRWRRAFSHPVGTADDLASLAAYLDRHMHEAARHVLFASFARELAATVRQLENVLHDGDRPETSRVPCLECGTRLVKVYGHHEADDHHVCPRCGDTYDRGRFERAKHDHLASKGAERYVSVTDAVATIGRPEQTVRSWIRRGLVQVDRHPQTRRLLVWWPHVREQHLAAQERKR